MHNKLLIRKLATDGLKMRRIKKVKCASPGQEQKKKIACPPSHFRTNVHKSGDSMQICHIFKPIACPKPSVLHRPPTVFILRERCFMRIFRRALIFSTPFAQNFSTFGQTSLLLEKSAPLFQPRCMPHSRQGTKKGLHPNSLYSPLSFNPNMKQRFRLLRVARVYLVAPVAASKALFTAFCAPFSAAALALAPTFFASLSTTLAPRCAAALAFLLQAFALFSAAFAPFSTAFAPRCAAALALSSAAFASLATAFAPFSTAALALFSAAFTSAAAALASCCAAALAFAAPLQAAFLPSSQAFFGLVCLIACGLRGLLTCGGSLLGAFLAARFHFFLSCIGIHLHHLSGSSGTYGENGGESQTAEQRVEIEFHCSVVLVVISIRIGVSFVKTHGVIFYRRHVFPVCACKCNT